MRKEIKTRTIEDTFYIADDGKTFKLKSDCLKYEAQKLLEEKKNSMHIKTIPYVDFDTQAVTLYQVANKEQWDYLIKTRWYQSSCSVAQFIPGWYMEIPWGGDYEGYDVFSVQGYINEMESYIKDVRRVINEKV